MLTAAANTSALPTLPRGKAVAIPGARGGLLQLPIPPAWLAQLTTSYSGVPSSDGHARREPGEAQMLYSVPTPTTGNEEPSQGDGR